MVCNRIQGLRREAGLTQMEVADRLGISQAAYSRLEKGEVEISITKLMDLAAIYGVKSSQILEGL